MNENTKLCCDLFTGCQNVDCTYAHSLSEVRWGIDYAMEDVYFRKPADANKSIHGSMPEPDASYLPKFIVTLEEDDEEENDLPACSMSLTQLDTITSAWQLKKMKDAYWTRLWALLIEYQRLTDHMGEMEMDVSE